jgi:hypothetical protein
MAHVGVILEGEGTELWESLQEDLTVEGVREEVYDVLLLRLIA